MKKQQETKSSSLRKPSYLSFDDSDYPWKPDIDYLKHPERYRVGKGEQGVLICEPYKSIIGSHWRFKNPDLARKSAAEIHGLFLEFLSGDDFVGADMARKYLQMGYTRARRYANYRGGKKYDRENRYAILERGTGEESKAEAASIFYAVWKQAEENPSYRESKEIWKREFG